MGFRALQFSYRAGPRHQIKPSAGPAFVLSVDGPGSVMVKHLAPKISDPFQHLRLLAVYLATSACSRQARQTRPSLVSGPHLLWLTRRKARRVKRILALPEHAQHTRKPARGQRELAGLFPIPAGDGRALDAHLFPVVAELLPALKTSDVRPSGAGTDRPSAGILCMRLRKSRPGMRAKW
jgi:hypothetical protein